jgi:hypothetical protein
MPLERFGTLSLSTSTSTPSTTSNNAHSPSREHDVKRARPVSYTGPSLSSVLSFTPYTHTRTHTHAAQLTPERGRAVVQQVYGAVHTPGQSASSVAVGAGGGIPVRPAGAEHGRAVPAAVCVWAVPPSADVDAELAAGVFTGHTRLRLRARTCKEGDRRPTGTGMGTSRRR